MKTSWCRSAPQSVSLFAIYAFASSCATSQSQSPGATVPQSAGTVASPSTCPVTGAWDTRNQPVVAPEVTRCVLPRYPPQMRASGEEGEIVFRVAIDSAGVPDSSTLQVVRTSTPALVASIRAAVPYLRFAAMGATTVVELPFTFTLRR